MVLDHTVQQKILLHVNYVEGSCRKVAVLKSIRAFVATIHGVQVISRILRQVIVTPT